MRFRQRLATSDIFWQLSKRHPRGLALESNGDSGPACGGKRGSLPGRRDAPLRKEEMTMAETVTAVEAVEHPSATQPRGERGRFGERPRTVKAHAARLQAAFMRTVTEADVAAIAHKLIEQAREGDATSARLVLKYGLGEQMGHLATDWTLENEAKAEARAAAAPTNEQVMAALNMKMQEQQALEADILRMGGAGPRPATERRPGPGAGARPGSPGSPGR
jgi:hypothetical protein